MFRGYFAHSARPATGDTICRGVLREGLFQVSHELLALVLEELFQLVVSLLHRSILLLVDLCITLGPIVESTGGAGLVVSLALFCSVSALLLELEVGLFVVGPGGVDTLYNPVFYGLHSETAGSFLPGRTGPGVLEGRVLLGLCYEVLF